MEFPAHNGSPYTAAVVTTTVVTIPAHADDSLPSVTAKAETSALFDDEAGGNANGDDPAIWRDSDDPERSLVIATAKEGGLRVYDLDAREVQSIPAPQPPGPDDAPGRFNNVDIVSNLAVVSDRGNDRLRSTGSTRGTPAARSSTSPTQRPRRSSRPTRPR